MGLHFETSDDTCRYVREQTDTVILGFSTGKDSTAAWLKLREHDFKVIPILQLFCPGPPENDGKGMLPYLARTVKYYEDFFGQRIYHIPHVSFYTSMAGKTYQPPDRFDACEELNSLGYFPILEHERYNRWIKGRCGLQHAWVATGIRMHDNLMRRTAIKKHGSAQPNRQVFYPVWDYTIEQVRQSIVNASVRLSEDYQWFYRSMGGIDARFAQPLRDHSPEDFAVLKHWYPMVDLDIFRLECRERLLAQQKQDQRG